MNFKSFFYGPVRRHKVPYLKLSGVWLEEAGFTISSKVNVIVRNKLLIIENVNQ